MSFLLSIMLLIFIIASAIILIASLISKKTYQEREKSSPFECGFDPFSQSRIPFSLRFYMIAIIFLVFDIEIAIILPIPIIINLSNTMVWFSLSSMFILILIIGLLHEWNFGALSWSH